MSVVETAIWHRNHDIEEETFDPIAVESGLSLGVVQYRKGVDK
jgi:hypothetical protein